MSVETKGCICHEGSVCTVPGCDLYHHEGCNVHRNYHGVDKPTTGETELLPCPFCGSESVVWSDCFQRVRCNGCFIGTPSISPAHARTDETTAALKARSIAQWNTRTSHGEGEQPAAWACVWEEDSDGVYQTSCQNAYQFTEGSPSDNSAEYCIYCGKPISELKLFNTPEQEKQK